jgi:hypothetical protein
MESNVPRIEAQKHSHPVALIFHLLFRSLAIVAYVFANWVFASRFILGSVIIILCLAFDFWTVKNVTGRLLVGLRWWNEIKEDGSNVWIFESKEVCSLCSCYISHRSYIFLANEESTSEYRRLPNLLVLHVHYTDNVDHLCACRHHWPQGLVGSSLSRRRFYEYGQRGRLHKV